jgi:hypothetical protein
MAHSSTDIVGGALLTTGVLAVVVASGWSSWLPTSRGTIVPIDRAMATLN